MPAHDEGAAPARRRRTGAGVIPRLRTGRRAGAVPGRIARALARHRTGGTIRARIARTLALPVAATLVLLGVIAVGEIHNYRTAAQTDRAVTLDLTVLDLVDALQTERGLAVGLLGGATIFRAQLAPARQTVDRQRAAVEDLTDRGGEVEDRVAAVIARLDGLAAIRATTDTGAGARDATAAFYTDLIRRLINVDFGVGGVDDSDLRRAYATLSMFNVAKESAAQERLLLAGVFAAGRFGPGEFVQFVAAKSARDSAVLAFNQYGNPAAIEGQRQVLNTPSGKKIVAMENAALAAADGRALKVDPSAWWTASGELLGVLLNAGKAMGTGAQETAASIKDRAVQRLGVLGAAVVLCLAGAVYLAAVASRWLARPLAALAEEAGRIGAESLPEAVHRATAGGQDTRPPPVRVTPDASDEVRQVADALERVQSTAYALATEQARLRLATAESLANLGRRNQNLVRRQLGFITRLEGEETSPTGLANLFELDHLATRMRRNAESLLVLVGAASPRQWAEPLPISDVIRAAISEVEEYRRVTLRRVDDVLVDGSVVGSVAHMLAELIENGLVFSPPDMDVEIHGRVVGGGYLIAVIDSGIGMTPADMDRANRRLRGDGDFITAPARYLGHFVVGRLAAETGVQVELTPSPVTGVTARVALPAALISERAPIAPADRGPRPAPHATVAMAPSVASRGLPPAPGVQNVPLRSDTIEFIVVPDGDSAEGAPGDAGHTPNGLRKRSPRRKRAGSPPPEPVEMRPAPAVITDTPEAVRDRLTAFRSGVLRAGADNGGRP
ncbi:nitrate- and nitrite sensing domain-containing protein [Actinoplanes sp. CA-030573]|uniref:sensor histidine kinase n=1 Tax=Actinoplanes sp. CA-030573 TaxID=3239898 RepID=UPI003D8F88E0